MNKAVDLVKLASVVFDRQCELIELIKKHLVDNNIDFQDKVLEDIVMRMDSKYFLTKSELQNGRISFHTKIEDIMKDNLGLVQNVCSQIDMHSTSPNRS